jgi:hypothetical protein
MMAGSPIIARLRRSTIPFTYDTTLDSSRRSDGKANQVLSLFERVNLRRGVYIPVHDVHGTCGAIAFGGNRDVVNAAELKELTYKAGYLFGRLSEIREIRSPMLRCCRGVKSNACIGPPLARQPRKWRKSSLCRNTPSTITSAAPPASWILSIASRPWQKRYVPD